MLDPKWLAWRKGIADRAINKAILREARKKFVQAQKKENRYKLRFRMAEFESKKRKKHVFKWLIGFDDFKWLCDEPCWYCNGVLGQVKFGKGLDRIDSTGDYTLDNVYPCCNTCNRIKGHDLSSQEAKAIIGGLLLLRRIESSRPGPL